MPIYRAMLKYGYENFSFEILEYCAKEDCVKIETLYIANLKPEYNICQVGRSRLGIKHTLAMRAKISAIPPLPPPTIYIFVWGGGGGENCL